jgi:hypothetical protein
VDGVGCGSTNDMNMITSTVSIIVIYYILFFCLKPVKSKVHFILPACLTVRDTFQVLNSHKYLKTTVLEATA